VILLPMHKMQRSGASSDYRTRDISRNSNIEIAISWLLTLSHPA
jgi:hypothetical protein